MSHTDIDWQSHMAAHLPAVTNVVTPLALHSAMACLQHYTSLPSALEIKP